MMSNVAWAKEQWQEVNLGDKRTNERAVLIGQRIAEKPDASLPAQMGSKTELQAAYRFLNNRVTTYPFCVKCAKLLLWLSNCWK